MALSFFVSIFFLFPTMKRLEKQNAKITMNTVEFAEVRHERTKEEEQKHTRGLG